MGRGLSEQVRELTPLKSAIILKDSGLFLFSKRSFMDKIFNKWFDGVIKKWEGGAALRPYSEDPGGLTKHGVTIGYWRREAHKYVNKPPTEEALLGIDWNDARTIAYEGFWKKKRINRIFNPALRPIVADAYWLGGGLTSLGFNSIQELNRSLFTSPGKLYNKRMAYLRSLSNWAPNAKGWTNRINDVSKIAKSISRKRLIVAGSVVVLTTGAGILAYRLSKK